MKITVIDKVSKNKIGVLNKNGVVPKPNEEFTFENNAHKSSSDVSPTRLMIFSLLLFSNIFVT